MDLVIPWTCMNADFHDSGIEELRDCGYDQLVLLSSTFSLIALRL
jgi:hypothetical protein